jgi:TRAP-type C4-dicarboxylate transport system permease small subunit
MKDLLIKFADEIIKPGTDTAPSGVKPVAGGADTLENNIINIINGVIGVLGLAAVVIVIIGGVQYMTSSGDAGKVKKAKDTILYGIIGLIICILAFAIVNFIIRNVIQ